MTDLAARLGLRRPLAAFDIEATGTNPRVDRIVELAIAKLVPGEPPRMQVFRINPQVPIPAEAIAIHGIRPEDVADCPSFKQLAGQLLELLAGCDLAGYNLLRFDIPMLEEEFRRAGIVLDLQGRRVYDAQRVFHKREPRDLAAALTFYCNARHDHAHGAEADVVATLHVIEGQLEKYPDLPGDMDWLHEYCSLRKPGWADEYGRLKWAGGQVVINFGRKQGTPLKDVVEHDRSYVKWLLNGDFPGDTKEIVRNALEGRYPAPPPAQDPRE